MAKEINVIGHKIEIGAGSSSGHPDFKGQQTSDIRSWIRIDGGEWYKIAHGFNILQILELFEYCKRESQVLAIFEMLGDVLRVKAKPPLNESVLPISDVSQRSELFNNFFDWYETLSDHERDEFSTVSALEHYLFKIIK